VPDYYGARINKRYCQLPYIRNHQIKLLDADPFVHKCCNKEVHHFFGTLVHGNVRYEDFIFQRGIEPLLVGINNERRVWIQLSVTGSNEINVIGRDFFQILFNDLAKGHHDLGIIALGSLVYPALVGNKEISGCNVGTKKNRN